ncbi:MAG: polyprenol monophosphomannose synthase [Chloroflexota bacterium]|nr:polyprenol monophosphomannose synthase [Chloroflexota bacterium]
MVLPTYNEADNLPAMVAALLGLPVPNLHIIVVDDASPDGTGDIADRLARHHEGRIHVLHRTEKRGLGRAYVAGFKRALSLGAEYIVQMDADFSHSPEDVIRLLDGIVDADVVIGSRYVSGGELDGDWNWGRRFLSWWANAVWTQSFLGLSVSDSTAGFKCWRRHTLAAIDLDQIRSNGYVFQVEMCYVTERLGFRTVEIPIFFEDRRVGQSKMTMSVKFEAAWRVFDIRWRHRNLTKQVTDSQAVPVNLPQSPRETGST